MSKKMILAIFEELDSSIVMDALSEAGYPVTLIDTTGGLLRQKNSSLMVAVDPIDVDKAIEIISGECQPSANPFQKRATIMVLGVDHFEQIP